MADPNDVIIGLLRAIDGTLKQLLALSQKRVAASTPKAVASDRDLDGPHGDPEIKFNPRDWTGESYKGRHFSECPADYLDLVADSFDYFARQADEKDERTTRGRPVSDYKRADAARARGWAKRIREGTHQPEAVGASEWAGGDGF